MRCVEFALAGGVDDEHRHVTALEASGAGGRVERWTLVQVVDAIRGGALFVTGGSQPGQAAVVEPTVCPRCPRLTLVTHPPGALAAVPQCE